MHEDLAYFCVKTLENLGAGYVEARVKASSSTQFLLKNGNLEISSFEKPQGIGARFIVGGNMGFFSSNRMDRKLILEGLKKAVSASKRVGNLGEKIKLTGEKSHKKKYSVFQKIKIENISPEEKIGLLKDADKELLSTKVNVPNRFFSYSDSITTEDLVTSEGSCITATVPRASMFYVISIGYKSKMNQRYWQYGNTGGWEKVLGWGLSDIMRNEALAQQDNLRNGIKAPKGVMDFVVAPQVVGIMTHESVGHPYEADRILGREAAQAGESFVTKDMLGTRIGSNAVTVVDDPTVENSFGFYLFDNEGVKARRKYLMKNGMINEFLHNRQTAAEMGLASSNGSSRATDHDKESIVRMSNTFVLPGKYSEGELIEGVKNGIFMKNFNEWNIDDKRLNQKYVGAESFIIKNGRIGKPVLNPIIEISTKELWRAVDAVADNTEFHAGNCGKGEPMQAIPVWFGGPSLRLRKIRCR